MLVIETILALLLHMFIVTKVLSNGNPLPYKVTKYPPLLPPFVIDSEDTTRFMLRAKTPVAKLAIPYGVTWTNGVN